MENPLARIRPFVIQFMFGIYLPLLLSIVIVVAFMHIQYQYSFGIEGLERVSSESYKVFTHLGLVLLIAVQFAAAIHFILLLTFDLKYFLLCLLGWVVCFVSILVNPRLGLFTLSACQMIPYLIEAFTNPERKHIAIATGLVISLLFALECFHSFYIWGFEGVSFF
jgi:hypothetical protein